MLGKENVIESIKQYVNATRVIHIHGVRGYEEHLSLSALPTTRVHGWLRCLMGSSFQGVMILEVFTPRDLEESMAIVLESASLGAGEQKDFEI